MEWDQTRKQARRGGGWWSLRDSTMGICPWAGHCQEVERKRDNDEHFNPVALRLRRRANTAESQWIQDRNNGPQVARLVEVLAFTFTADAKDGSGRRRRVLVWVRATQTLWALWRDVRHQDAGIWRRRRRMDKRLPFSLLSLALNPHLYAVLPGHTRWMHSHGVHREPQWVQLWAHQTEDVPGSALQHHLYAQSPESLWPTDGSIGHGGELFNTHFFYLKI